MVYFLTSVVLTLSFYLILFIVYCIYYITAKINNGPSASQDRMMQKVNIAALVIWKQIQIPIIKEPNGSGDWCSPRAANFLDY